MTKRWSIGAIVLALAVLTAVPTASAGEGGTDRPFKARLSGEVHWEFPGNYLSDCEGVTTVTEAVGQVTHLGRVSMLSSHCPDEETYNDGRLILTAANGDTLIGVYDYPTIFGGAPVVFTEGTGRFADVSGSAVWVIDLVPMLKDGCDNPDDFACLDFFTPWPWWSTLTGTISM